jgi:DNA phosphorothioation-dependent restriction protein DptG
VAKRKKTFANVFDQDDEQFNDEKAYLIKQVTMVIKLGVFLRRRCSERLILGPVL